MNDAIPAIAPTDLHARLQSGTGLLLLDVLPGFRYQQVHLPGAANACVFEVTFPDQVAALTADTNSEIVVYGAGAGSRDAATAAAKLQRAGYRRVAVLAGGLASWQKAGFPVAGTGETAPEALQPADGHYRIDTAASAIAWIGRNPNSSHHGTLQLADGRISLRSGVISGEFELDMTSIRNLNLAGDDLQPVLEAHLKSDDFFFVSRFPRAHFAMTATPTLREVPVSAPNYQVAGELSLCGTRAAQEFPATIVAREDGTLAAEAHFDFDRTRWGVIYGSSRFFRHLGMHLVFDLISLQLRLVTGPPLRP